jgi:phosphoribosylglycinamide formyltransferase 1
LNGPSLRKKRVAVLISGRGSNMAALVAAARDPAYPAEIVAVLSNKADAAGLAFARDNGIAARAVPQADYPYRKAHEAALGEALADIGPDIICLAGYMRLMSPEFVEQWQGRMINIHPALLPSFKGLDTHARALEAGVRIHGCSVHFVTAGMDDGPIIAQAAVPVVAGDTEETLTARVLAAEHRLYPLALRMVAEGRVQMRGGHAIVTGASDATGMLISA